MSLVLPNPKKVLEKRFLDKIDIFRALNLEGTDLIMERILGINKIRNKFSHNLTFRLSLKEIQPLVKGLKLGKNHTLVRKLKCSIGYVVGGLHFLRGYYGLLPFTSACIRNSELYKKEKGVNLVKIVKSIYPENALSVLIGSLKLEE